MEVYALLGLAVVLVLGIIGWWVRRPVQPKPAPKPPPDPAEKVHHVAITLVQKGTEHEAEVVADALRSPSPEEDLAELGNADRRRRR